MFPARILRFESLAAAAAAAAAAGISSPDLRGPLSSRNRLIFCFKIFFYFFFYFYFFG